MEREPAVQGNTVPDSHANIDVRALSKTFHARGRGTVRALREVSLQVHRGEMVVLLGPSGCGKTTLLRCIAGLETADSGTVGIEGRTVFSATSTVNVPPEKRNISMMFQTYAVWPHLTVEENIAFPLASRGHAKRETRRRVDEIVTTVGLHSQRLRYPHQLSGGQQQRVALARSLVVDPTTILFDEPLSNVDARVREELRTEILLRQGQFRFAGVYVTHDQVEALELADRVAVMDEGQIVQIGTPEEVYWSPVSKYVASFVGTINQFLGEVVDTDSDGLVTTQTACGILQGRWADSCGRPSVGESVMVGVRPESFTVVEAPGTERTNVVKGIVEASLFGGVEQTCLVRVGERVVRVTMRAEGRGQRPVAVGRSVGLRFVPEDAFAFGSDDD